MGGFKLLTPAFDVLLPVGISFYTFQALSYTIDVYRNENFKVETHFGRYALFVTFFPQLVAGPIERSENLLSQFYEEHRFEWERVKNGLLLMLWGLFEKIVIADRAAIVVNQVYNNLGEYAGVEIVVATMLRWPPVNTISREAFILGGLIGTESYGLQPDDKFQTALFFAIYQGILETLAYFVEFMAARLCIYPAGRESMFQTQKIQESDDYIFDQRPMAWCKLDLCDMGRNSRNVSDPG